jgi:hypothetical protein
MAKYKLTDALEVEFTFSIGDKEWTFRKPTVREMRLISKKFAGIDKEENVNKQMELSDAAMKEIYALASPIDHSTSLEDALMNQSVGVQKAFNEMIKKELGAS